MSESSSTIFSQIAARQIPAEFLYEDEEIMVIKDIRPAAPIHVLIIPKKIYPTLEAIPTDSPLMTNLFLMARKMAHQLGIAKNYRLLMNVGENIQAVPHVHLHLMGGWEKPSPNV